MLEYRGSREAEEFIKRKLEEGSKKEKEWKEGKGSIKGKGEKEAE
jgi:hypothetical protein